MERFNLSDQNIDGFRVISVVLHAGSTPSQAEVRREITDGQRLEPPSEIEIFAGEERIFQGCLTSGKQLVNCDNPHQMAEYRDARHALASVPFPLLHVWREGEIAVEDYGETVFNPKGEANKEPNANALSMDPVTAVPWSGLDVIKYLAEYSFAIAPSCQLVNFSVDLLPADVQRRLAVWRPSSLRTASKSPFEVLCEVLDAVGAEASLDNRSVPALIAATLPWSVGCEGVTLDAGTPGGNLWADNPPDLYSYELSSDFSKPPGVLAISGLKQMVETGHTLYRRMTEQGYEECALGEGDLIPGWTNEEERLYMWLEDTDPGETNEELRTVRESVWKVHRLYRLNPLLDFGAFFGQLMGQCEFDVCTSFSRHLHAPLPPEVSIHHLLRSRWTLPVDDFGQFIGASLAEQGKAVLFDRRVSLQTSSNPDVTQVRDIALSLCLVARQPSVVQVDAVDVFGPAVDTSGRRELRRRGYFSLVAAGDDCRVAWKRNYPRERDDAASLEMEAWCALEKSRTFDRLSCRIHGLKTNLLPGMLVNLLTFERGSGTTQ